MRAPRFAAWLCVCLHSTSGLAQDDEPSKETGAEGSRGGNQITAEALFQEAKALIRAGNHAAACPKLADSHRLDPAGGTVLALALCQQETRKFASAWAAFREALAWARQDGRADRAKIAEARALELEPRLSRIIVTLSPAVTKIPGVVAFHNGTELGENTLGAPLPVDGGRHEVRVTAPGYQEFRRGMAVVDEKGKATVHVERLEPLEPPAPKTKPVKEEPRPKPIAPPEPSSDLPPAPGYVALGLGAVGLASATYFGLSARGNADEADQLCPASPCSNQDGVDKNEAARSQATVAAVSGVVGLVGVGAGLWILLSPSKEVATQSAVVSVAIGQRGATGHYRLRF